jgi:hypothetical protein
VNSVRTHHQSASFNRRHNNEEVVMQRNWMPNLNDEMSPEEGRSVLQGCDFGLLMGIEGSNE